MTDTYTPVLTDAEIAMALNDAGITDYADVPLSYDLEIARAIERAAIEAYQRQQKERFRSLVYTASPLIEAAAAEGKRVAETPHGPVFFSCVGDDPACPDEPDDWQPIETAPTNGQPVLLFARLITATASTRVVGAFIDGEWLAQHYSGDRPVLVPSHWMPLPDFPGCSHA